MVEIVGRGATPAQKRRARKEAVSISTRARRSVKRHGARLPTAQRDEIVTSAQRLDEAIEKDDHDLICERMAILAELSDQHLHSGKKSAFREYFGSIGVAVLVALVLRAFVFEAFKIPSGSMIPTIAVGDHIFVNKFIYGLRIPFTKIKFFEWNKPKRGEIIVFIDPVKPDIDLIKRVVALEGDSVEVRKGLLYVNGQPVEHKRLPGDWSYWDYDEQREKWVERIAGRVEEDLGGHHYTTLRHAHPLEDFGGYLNDYPPNARPSVVPPNTVFCLGDNRDNSNDSRFIGPVPLENIKGRALVVWWSQGMPENVRWGRIGHLVE